MKHLPKFTCILLTIILLLPIIAACSSGTDDNGSDGTKTDSGAAVTDVETVETSTTTAISTVPSLDYGGYEFKIVTQNMDKRDVDMVAEEQNGATLNDLVYTRNATIEEKFNITLTVTSTDHGSINSTIQKNVSAGDSTYDMYLSNATAWSLARDGYLIPVNSVPYIDLTAPWWDQNQLKDMSIGGVSYLVTGDISPTGLETSECILFNKKLFDDRGITYPYQTAFDGKWTLDEMHKISTGLTTDLNGDGIFKNTDDLFSYTMWSDAAHAMFFGAGGYYVSKDQDDIPYLTWDVDRYTDIYNKIYNLVINDNANYETANHVASFDVFKEGRAYFCGIVFLKIDLFLRDMEQDFGVLPEPKYDEAQERYIANVSGAGSMLVIPKGAKDIDMVGAVTEAMAAASYDIITPSLYSVIVQTKNVRDEESAKMVDLIIRNRIFDIAHEFYIDIDDYVQNLLKQKSTDVASYFASREEKAHTTLSDIVTKFLANKDA
jgi:ABC-type glycerol-3-phosphate transport system substrate-binding protein